MGKAQGVPSLATEINPGLLKVTTDVTTTTRLINLGVDGQSYIGYWAGNNEVFFNIINPDKMWTIDIQGLRYLRVDTTPATPEVAISSAGTRCDLRIYDGQLLFLDSSQGLIGKYLNVGTVGTGVSPIFGMDNRTGVTVVDGSPITLYTVPGSGQLYRLGSRLNLTTYTSGTVIYTLTYTEHSVAHTIVVSAAAIDTVQSSGSFLIHPDSGSAITAQVTGPFVATANVAAAVQRLA